ncbi:MAG: sigma-70 family RNA polymerase sigma factor [Thermomicrobiales bacterium]
MTFAERIEALRTQLVSYIYKRFPSFVHMAEDLVQEANLIAWQHRDRFRGGDSNKLLFSWLQTIIHRRALSEIAWSHKCPATPLVNETVDDEGPPSLMLRLHEAQERIERAISNLPERERVVVDRIYRLGWSPSRVANELESTPNAIAGLKLRAIQRLRSKLDQGDLSVLLCGV